MPRGKPRQTEGLIPAKNRKMPVTDMSTNYRLLTLEEFIDEMRAIKDARVLGEVIELDQVSSK